MHWTPMGFVPMDRDDDLSYAKFAELIVIRTYAEIETYHKWWAVKYDITIETFF